MRLNIHILYYIVYMFFIIEFLYKNNIGDDIVEGEKMVAIFQINIDESMKDIDEVSMIRKIHKNIPRKLTVSDVVNTSIDNDKATCTVKLKRAQMISIDEIKQYISQTGERTTMKRFLGWLDSLK